MTISSVTEAFMVSWLAVATISNTADLLAINTFELRWSLTGVVLIPEHMVDL